MDRFTPGQDAALKAVGRWLKSKPGRDHRAQVFRLFGYAGTGKTSLAKHIAESVSGKVLFAAFTGKAALVMRAKGCQNASTIHSLIYRPVDLEEEEPSFQLWGSAPASKAQLIIIDECSMVDAHLGRDLLSFGVPVLVLGDPAQLPPVQGTGFFTTDEPDVVLTEVHRQEQDDPIVRLSMEVRSGHRLTPGRYGQTEVVKRAGFDPARVLETDQILVGRNLTRRAYNARIRQLLGLEGSLPFAGDKLVCLRNNRQKGLFNGALWKVKQFAISRSNIITMRLCPEDSEEDRVVKVSVRPECFLTGLDELEWSQRRLFDEFDYGYVLTVHKAQGSQWDDVVLFDKSFAFPESRARWLYTGITRAAKRLTVVV